MVTWPSLNLTPATILDTSAPTPRETCAAWPIMAPDIATTGPWTCHAHSPAAWRGGGDRRMLALSVERSGQQLADGNDDVLLFLNPGSPGARDRRRTGWCASAAWGTATKCLHQRFGLFRP